MCVFVNFSLSKISRKLLDFFRILKFGTNIVYDKSYCVTKNQPHIAYQFLYLSIFLSLQQKFLSQISQLLFESGSSNFVYTLRLAKYIA